MAAGESDEQLAERLANAAGAILLDLRASGLVGKRLGKAGDEAANAMLCREIRAARPADALLSEEEQDNAARCGQSRVWIVDPLDGPREYGEGRDDWRSEEHTSELQSLMRSSYAVLCLNKKRQY